MSYVTACFYLQARRKQFESGKASDFAFAADWRAKHALLGGSGGMAPQENFQN